MISLPFLFLEKRIYPLGLSSLFVNPCKLVHYNNWFKSNISFLLQVFICFVSHYITNSYYYISSCVCCIPEVIKHIILPLQDGCHTFSFISRSHFLFLFSLQILSLSQTPVSEPPMNYIEGEPPVSVLPSFTFDNSDYPSPSHESPWLPLILFASIVVVAIAVILILAYSPTFLKWLRSPPKPPRAAVAPLPLTELNVVQALPPEQDWVQWRHNAGNNKYISLRMFIAFLKLIRSGEEFWDKLGRTKNKACCRQWETS